MVQEPRQNALFSRFGLQAVLTLVLIVVSISRCPAAFREPILYAEDGNTFFKTAWELPAKESIFAPVAGYLILYDRAGTEIALLFGPAAAPFVMVLFWELALILPAALILSGRFAPAMPSIWMRALFAGALVALPNTAELYGNITSSQWYLALYAALSLAIFAPRTKAGIVFDLVAISLSFLTGPFAILFFPALLFSIFVKKRRIALVERRDWALLALAAGCAAIQIRTILAGRPADFSKNLGASALELARIFGGQVVLGLGAGLHGFRAIVRLDAWQAPSFPIALSLGGLVVIVAALVRGGTPLRVFALCAGAVFSAALLSPTATHPAGAWFLLAMPGSASRYWLFPIVLLLWSCFELSRSKPWIIRICGVILLCGIAAFGLRNDFVLRPSPAPGQHQALERLENNYSGEEVSVPGVPPQFLFTVRAHKNAGD